MDLELHDRAAFRSQLAKVLGRPLEPLSKGERTAISLQQREALRVSQTRARKARKRRRKA